jgi:cobalt-zinc-cadmium efflux system membrane fusion protein
MKYIFSLILALTLMISVAMAHGGEDHDDQSNQQQAIGIINKQDNITLAHTNYTPYVLDLLLFITVIAFINVRYRNLSQKAGRKAALSQTTPYAVISAMLLAGSVWAIHYVIPSSETSAVASTPINNPTNLNPDLVTISKESQLLFGIQTEQAKLEKLVSGLIVTGVVRMQSQNRAEVVPPVSGRIKAVGSFTVGSYVKQGQTLAVVEQVLSATDIASLEATRTDLRAKTAELQAQATQALTRRNAAEIELERAKKLYDAGAVALKRVQEAELQLKLADEELKAANLRAEITQSGEKKVDPIKTFLLQAPISGLIIQSGFVSGSQVEAGKSVLTIANLDHVWVEAQVFEKDLSIVTSAKRAIFKTSAFPDLNIQIGEGSNNRLLTLGTTVDPEKHTLPVTYEVTNVDGKLRDGMNAEITIDTSNNREVVSVPKAAVVDEQGQKVVYVYNGGERFSKRIVKLGGEGQASFEVISGLDAGERIAVTGLYQIRAGSAK